MCNGLQQALRCKKNAFLTSGPVVGGIWKKQ
jgi:hypothetical protein